MPVVRRIGELRSEKKPRESRPSVDNVYVSLERIILNGPFYERVMPRDLLLVGLQVHLTGRIPKGTFQLVVSINDYVRESKEAQSGRNTLLQLEMAYGSVLTIALVEQDDVPDVEPSPISATVSYSYTSVVK